MPSLSSSKPCLALVCVRAMWCPWKTNLPTHKSAYIGGHPSTRSQSHFPAALLGRTSNPSKGPAASSRRSRARSPHAPRRRWIAPWLMAWHRVSASNVCSWFKHPSYRATLIHRYLQNVFVCFTRPFSRSVQDERHISPAVPPPTRPEWFGARGTTTQFPCRFLGHQPKRKQSDADGCRTIHPFHRRLLTPV